MQMLLKGDQINLAKARHRTSSAQCPRRRFDPDRKDWIKGGARRSRHGGREGLKLPGGPVYSQTA